MKNKAVGITLVIGGLALIGFALLMRRPDDRTLILESLKESILASKEGRSGSVLEYLSKDIKLNGTELFNRGEVAKFIKNAQPEVEVVNAEPVIDGDEAIIESPVRVKMKVAVFTAPAFEVDAKIRFRREIGHEYLVVPVTRWRIVNVEATDIPTIN